MYSEYFLVDSYTKYQKNILKKYGNYKVNKIYLIKNTVDILDNYFIKSIIKIFTPESKIILNNNFKHCALICELKRNKEHKLILIEKNASLRIRPNFNIKEGKLLKTIKLEKDWKFKDILNNTKKRVGKKKFFYWDIFENNCQHLIKELLITLEKYNNENEKFIIQDVNHLKIFPKLKILTVFTNLVNLLY